MTHAQHAEFSTLAGKGTIGKVRKGLTARSDNIQKIFNIVSKAYDKDENTQARKKARTIPATSNRDKASRKSSQEKLKKSTKCAEITQKAAQIASDAAFAVVNIKKKNMRYMEHNIKKFAKVYSDGILSEIREATGARMLLSEAAAEADQSDADGLILLAVGAVEEAGAVEEDELFVEEKDELFVAHAMKLRDRGSLAQTYHFEPPLDSLVRGWRYRISAKRDCECIVHATRFIDYVFTDGDGCIERTNPHNGREDRLLVWGGSDVDKCYKHMLGPTATKRHLSMGCTQENLKWLWLCALDPRGWRKETHCMTSSEDREVLDVFLVNSESDTTEKFRFLLISAARGQLVTKQKERRVLKYLHRPGF